MAENKHINKQIISNSVRAIRKIKQSSGREEADDLMCCIGKIWGRSPETELSWLALRSDCSCDPQLDIFYF